MYYVVIYDTFNKLGPKAVFHLVAGLEYTNRAEAERYKQELIQQAQNYGANIITYRGAENDGYTAIEGPVIFGISGMEPRKSILKKYKIGIEDDTNIGALVPEEEKSGIAGKTFIDGFSFEGRARRFKKQKDTKARAKQDIINKHFNSFKSEITGTNDIRNILELLLKYSKKVPQDLLIDSVVKKIQGEPEVEETDWYSELSDINEAMDILLTEAKTGIPYKGYIICYGCHTTDRWYVKDSYENFLGNKSGYSTEKEAQGYIDEITKK